ncbi:hypothetical protein CBR_g48646 [Chara braunii]|uniref:Integrase catalytic domain-containing protein n=1 Tax=Chara braunii TaxID=69332 RepID=A0A388M380_CHABU|nr:hypothetical protein CBR_g48646 [Chara braunii]|eukprot:GBG89038.1 hypothetical protein CBR_g48646 [Chara braunii]
MVACGPVINCANGMPVAYVLHLYPQLQALPPLSTECRPQSTEHRAQSTEHRFLKSLDGLLASVRSGIFSLEKVRRVFMLLGSHTRPKEVYVLRLPCMLEDQVRNAGSVPSAAPSEAAAVIIKDDGVEIPAVPPVSPDVDHPQTWLSDKSCKKREKRCKIYTRKIIRALLAEGCTSTRNYALGLPGQLANESLADYKKWFQAQIALIEAEEQRQRAAGAARLQAEAAATEEKQRLQAEADAETQARRKEAQVLLQRHEAASIDRLKFWHFEPNGDDATPEEQHKEFLSKLVTRLLYTCNYQQSELEKQNQELQQQYQDLNTQHQELANLRRMVQSHEDATRALNSRVLDLEQDVPGPNAGASSSAPSSRQLEERVDHVVAMLGDISTFAAPTTISSQLDTLKTEIQQLQSTNTDGNNPKQYKMPTFQLEKFDDYTHHDPATADSACRQARVHQRPVHELKGRMPDQVNSPGSHPRRRRRRFEGRDHMGRVDTTVEEAVHLPDLDLPFTHLRREFYNRSCAALSQALDDREQYTTFVEIIDKAREIIKTNRSAADEESTWQPTYVEKVRTGPRQQQFAAVQSDHTVEDPAATQASREGDQVAAVQPRSNNKPRVNGKAKSASPAGNGQLAPPWVKFGLTEAEYKYRGHGQTERAHQTAQMMLRTLIRPDQKDWVDRLPDIEFAYNTSVHPAIAVTPFELHHGGRKGRIFADLLLPRPTDIDAACSPASVQKYRELLTQARANMQKAEVRMQQQANTRRVPCPIRAGDLVWVSAEEFALEQDVSRKLLPKWFGPWSVTSAAGDEPDGPSFVINIPEHLTVHPVFHASKQATYTSAKSDDFPGRRSQDPPSMDGHQEVDRVISDRKYGSKSRQYKVTFRACDPDDTRWISGADLKASAPLIYAQYERQRLAKGPPRPAPPTRTEVPPSDKQLRPRSSSKYEQISANAVRLKHQGDLREASPDGFVASRENPLKMAKAHPVELILESSCATRLKESGKQHTPMECSYSVPDTGIKKDETIWYRCRATVKGLRNSVES